LIGRKGHVGNVLFNVSGYESIMPPPWFYSQLDIIETCFSREKEAGCRLIIAHYIGHAIHLAKRLTAGGRIVCSSEVEIPAESIEPLGMLSGVCDFIVGAAAGESNFGNTAIFLLSNL